MSSVPSSSAPQTDPPDAGGAPSVTVRYWAGARAAAGVDREQLRGGTVAEVLDAAVRAHPALRDVIPASSVLNDGRTAAPGEQLAAGAVLEVLPPFAGG
ncbi:MAG TPA: MoaD/ThiS family protein [Segeticoccus sp.]|nr:MoaD/ThiS family protein [Segeticoccus sp.]